VDDADPDESEFREFVGARSSALLRTAYLLTGDRALAEDLLQTALTKTYLSWHRVRDRAAAEAYVHRILVTTATSWWRTRWRREAPAESVPDISVADQTAELDDRDLIWRHLRALPVRQRAVLVLRYYEDRSEAEVAALLRCSTGTVKSHTSRALATLRRRLDAQALAEAEMGERRA
jgi:RNA polymerase sigma-70 factor, ECF subfamily